MGTSARRGRLAIAVTTAALIVSGGVATPLLTAGPAHASDLPGWNLPASVGGDEHNPQAMELASLSDGSAVAAWREGGNLTAAVRAADDDLWKRPGLSASGVTPRLPLRVAADTTGGATLAWAESAASAPGTPLPATRLLAAALRGGTWSQPQELLGDDAGSVVSAFQVAEGPRGTAVAVWSATAADGTDSGVYVARRGAGGAWSAPVAVVTVKAADGRIDGADVAVAATGDAVIAYRHTVKDGLPGIRTIERTGTDGTWSAPAPAAAPIGGTGTPNAGAGPDGSLALTWPLQEAEGTDAEDLFASVKRPGAAWSTPARLPIRNTPLATTSEPLIAPDGDVTLVWREWWWASGMDPGNTFASATLASGGDTWERRQIGTPWLPGA